jgi:hypothetical protein
VGPAPSTNWNADLTTEQDDTSKDQKHWIAEISRAEKHFEKWVSRSDKLVNLYRKQNDQGKGKRKFAILWANTEVLKPAVYARQPVPQVSRRFKDKDPVGRVACELLERSSTYELERMNIDTVLRCVRDDLLLPGRGTAWVRFDADINDVDGVEDQRVIIDYINWKQFLHGAARVWSEVPWVAKLVYLTNTQGKELFGDKWAAMEAAEPAKNENDERNPEKGGNKREVYEIWCKDTKKVYWVSKAAKDVLKTEDPVLRFENFFPVPEPVYATTTTDSLVPVPDYVYYQDQAEEIDDLTSRIGKLTDSLKLVGFYPAGGPEDVSAAVERALSPGVENVMIPISSWAAFAEKGGGGGIVYLPIREVAEVLKTCVELRQSFIQDTYQIAGISDIQRGSSDPNETAKAQEIKANWGSMRVRDKQQQLARFARDLVNMTCEVIAENFEPMRVMQMANMVPPQPPAPIVGLDGMSQENPHAAAIEKKITELEQAFALLKDERLRGFRIDIETDSTIQPDENAEKQRRTEFVQAVGALLQQAIPAVQVAPELAPLIGEMLTFTVRGFRAGRNLEDQVEQTMEAVMQRLQQQQQGPQNPNAAKDALEKERFETIEKPKAEAELYLLKVKAEKEMLEVAPTNDESPLDDMAKEQKLKQNAESHGMKMVQMIQDSKLKAANMEMKRRMQSGAN